MVAPVVEVDGIGMNAADPGLDLVSQRVQQRAERAVQVVAVAASAVAGDRHRRLVRIGGARLAQVNPRGLVRHLLHMGSVQFDQGIGGRRSRRAAQPPEIGVDHGIRQWAEPAHPGPCMQPAAALAPRRRAAEPAMLPASPEGRRVSARPGRRRRGRRRSRAMRPSGSRSRQWTTACRAPVPCRRRRSA